MIIGVGLELLELDGFDLVFEFDGDDDDFVLSVIIRLLLFDLLLLKILYKNVEMSVIISKSGMSWVVVVV